MIAFFNSRTLNDHASDSQPFRHILIIGCLGINLFQPRPRPLILAQSFINKCPLVA